MIYVKRDPNKIPEKLLEATSNNADFWLIDRFDPITGPEARSFRGWPGLFRIDVALLSGCGPQVATVAALSSTTSRRML